MRTNRYLAFDLGAETGRALVGELRGGTLELNEVCRFPNEPVHTSGSMQWDILRLWLEMTRALDDLGGQSFDSIGVDTWGCDFALLGENGKLLENPYCYRDGRTEGIMEAAFGRVPADRIYSVTGIQFLPFNTVFQLLAASRLTPRLLQAASTLVMIPDLLNYWLAGTLVSEYTIATTSQMVDARARSWAKGLLGELGLPARLLPPIVEPGTMLGPVRQAVSAGLAGTPVVAPACHDTGSAVAAVAARGDTVFLSSGTWSLLGAEVDAPVISTRGRELNFTNEGGIAGTTRLLKNITGMWLLQVCRREWASAGRELVYDELLAAAAVAPPFASLIDPDDPGFFHPSSMLEAIAERCRETDQHLPSDPGDYSRAILESLAFKYRTVVEALQELTGTRVKKIRIVGGGSRNRLLNQFTADATGCTVLAGPVEATALGNIAAQMLATRAVPSIAEAREIIERSFPVERFEPAGSDRWEREYKRFKQYLAG